MWNPLVDTSPARKHAGKVYAIVAGATFAGAFVLLDVFQSDIAIILIAVAPVIGLLAATVAWYRFTYGESAANS